MKVEEIAEAVAKLPPDQLARFRRWFTAFEAGRTDHAEELDSTATKLGRLFTNSARPPGALGKESQQAEPGQRQRTPHGVDQDRDLPARGPWQLTREEGAWRRYTPSSIGFVIDNQGALAMIPRLSDGIKKRLTRSDRCQYGSCARNS